MVAKADKSAHEFMVTHVETYDVPEADAVAVTLTDIRGGIVRLHLNTDMAELLREKITAALDKHTGP